MNTGIVWVMLTITSHGLWVPTLEFKDQAKCEAAAKAIAYQTTNGSTYRDPAPTGHCVGIEK